MRAISLVVIPTVVGLIGVICYDWKVPVARGLWLAAGVCIIVVLGLTMTYFVPSNAAFASKAIALDTWLLLHNVRIALALAASVLGIVAVNR